MGEPRHLHRHRVFQCNQDANYLQKSCKHAILDEEVAATVPLWSLLPRRFIIAPGEGVWRGSMQTYFRQRIEVLTARLDNLRSSLERARQSVTRLENESVPAGATALARAAQLSAARAMAATLADRERHLLIAIQSLQAELADQQLTEHE